MTEFRLILWVYRYWWLVEQTEHGFVPLRPLGKKSRESQERAIRAELALR
jgi:hypothetical protein